MTTHEDISKRAQEIWERDGRPEGRDMQHWFQAEAELRGRTSATQAAAKAAPASQAVHPDQNPLLKFHSPTKEYGARKRAARRVR